MAKATIVLLAILFAFSLTVSAGFQSTSQFTITLTFQGSTQTQADNRRDAAVLDYAKARRLAIYEADGVTVNPALVAPAVRADVKNQLKNVVVQYRESTASTAATSPIRGQVDSEIP
jgi:hypothetical protein